MSRRPCGYQIKIRIHAFRLRPRPTASGSTPFSGSPSDTRELAASSSQPPAHSTKPAKNFSPHALDCAASVKLIIEADLRVHYSIARLARKVGLNSRTLQDCFKHLYGKAIFEYLQDLRLGQGKKLLRETAMGIQEIAEACGYVEHTNFTVAFRRKYGVAPGVWRKGEG